MLPTNYPRLDLDLDVQHGSVGRVPLGLGVVLKVEVAHVVPGHLLPPGLEICGGGEGDIDI